MFVPSQGLSLQASPRITQTHTRAFLCAGTSLLRHILGSHPQAHEHVPEVIPTPAQLRSLRNQAVAAGKTILVIKHPVSA
jgi:hypothetical protein|eukprot:COSAG06_NODE_140_length_22325_cov_187.593404_4_plen_80_part_00